MVKNALEAGFEEIKKTILALRVVFDSALSSVSVSGRSAPEIHRSLKIDRTMAWKLSKLLSEDNVFQASSHMPGRAAVSNLLRAMKKAGVADASVAEIKKLSSEFFSLVIIHAGDRASFDMMMLSMSESGMAQAYQIQQKIQYSANSYLLGIQSKTQFTSWFFVPSKQNTDKVDTVVLRGIIDLERKRPRAPFVLQSLFHGDTRGRVIPSVKTVTLEDADDTPLGNCGFLYDFCSKPLPEVLDVQENTSGWTIRLADGPLGKTNRINLVSGEVFPGSESRWLSEDEEYWEVQTRVKTPTQAVVIDVLLHRSLVTSRDLVSDICQDFSDAMVVVPISRRASEARIPCYSSIKYIGSDLDVLTSRFIPDYRAMVQRVFQRTGWDEKEMHLFRITVEFPVTPSSVYIRIPIPERE